MDKKIPIRFRGLLDELDYVYHMLYMTIMDVEAGRDLRDPFWNLAKDTEMVLQSIVAPCSEIEDLYYKMLFNNLEALEREKLSLPGFYDILRLLIRVQMQANQLLSRLIRAGMLHVNKTPAEDPTEESFWAAPELAPGAPELIKWWRSLQGNEREIFRLFHHWRPSSEVSGEEVSESEGAILVEGMASKEPAFTKPDPTKPDPTKPDPEEPDLEELDPTKPDLEEPDLEELVLEKSDPPPTEQNDGDDELSERGPQPQMLHADGRLDEYYITFQPLPIRIPVSPFYLDPAKDYEVALLSVELVRPHWMVTDLKRTLTFFALGVRKEISIPEKRYDTLEDINQEIQKQLIQMKIVEPDEQIIFRFFLVDPGVLSFECMRPQAFDVVWDSSLLTGFRVFKPNFVSSRGRSPHIRAWFPGNYHVTCSLTDKNPVYSWVLDPSQVGPHRLMITPSVVRYKPILNSSLGWCTSFNASLFCEAWGGQRRCTDHMSSLYQIMHFHIRAKVAAV